MHKPAQLLKTEIMIAYVLRAGVIICGVIITFGVIVGLLHPHSHHGLSTQDLNRLVQGQMLDEAAAPRTVNDFLPGLKTGNAETIMALGLVLLIGLPVMRVALTVFLFLFEKDWAYLVITLIVLSILLTGIIFGKAL